jgi:hypothetical protein
MKEKLIRSIMKLFYKHHAPLWSFEMLARLGVALLVLLIIFSPFEVAPVQASTTKITIYADLADNFCNSSFCENDTQMIIGEIVGNPIIDWVPFRNIGLPTGVTLISVKIYLTAESDRANDDSKIILGFENVTNPIDVFTFSELSGLSMTSSGQVHSGVLAHWIKDTEYSYDLTDSFQELYTYGGWASGDGVGLIIADDGSSFSGFRIYYGSDAGNNSSQFARLEIEYLNPATDTPTNTAIYTVTHTPSNTSTDTLTPSETTTASDTPTYTFTPSHTPTETFTPSRTFTLTHTATDTFTSTPSDTPTETFTPTDTFTSTYTKTPTNTRTMIPPEVLTGTYVAAYNYYSGIAANNYPIVIILLVLIGILVLGLIIWGVSAFLKRRR